MAHIKHTIEEKLAKAKRICDVYAMGDNDLESCCDSEGIAHSTFKNWTYEIAEIGDAYKEARNKSDIARKGKLREIALSSAHKLAKGYEYQETTTEARDIKTGKVDAEGNEIFKPRIIKKVTTTKMVAPNPTMVMFILNNSNKIDDANFVNSRQMDITSGGEKVKALDLSLLSSEAIEKALELQQILSEKPETETE